MILLGIMSLAEIHLNAQLTNTSKEYHTGNDTEIDIEYATTGSTMPYKVAPFHWGPLQGLMKPSIFNWWLNGKASGYKLLKADGISPLEALPPPNHVYYPDSAIAIKWIEAGKYTIRVSEKTMPKNDVNLCDKAESFRTLDVIVTDKPRVSWKTSSPLEGCNLPASEQQIAINLLGTQQITLTYSIVFTSVNGSEKDTILEEKTFSPGEDETAFTDYLTITLPTGKYGTYQVNILDIKDKVSQKSGVKAIPGDYPAEPYILRAFPVPDPGPIRMIKVLK